ncbi:MAG TPA: radical SAM protein [Stellaceae bacterium]|nr:radical SAM protein [Stellaceae bacterium]
MAEERVQRMDGPVLVFGGPYSNLEATSAVLAEARRRGIPPERILCTGDIVAYAADAVATTAAVREAGIWAVRGNCEESLAAGAEDCGCGYAEGSACDRLASEWYAHAHRTLDAESRRWMSALPRRLTIEVGGRRLAVIHGGVRQINRFVFASTPEPVKRREIATLAEDGVIAGHSGIPFSELVAGTLWHNAGAIGMPANDGTPRTWFSLLIPTEEGLRIEHAALDYDHRSAARKMRAAGLPAGYADALETGRWPSLDVLPPAERAATGRAIEPGAVLWRRPLPDGEKDREKRLSAPSPHRGEGWSEGETLRWPAEPPAPPSPLPLSLEKFHDPAVTAKGEPRARVALEALKTLWFNTGTLCNITCAHCYIESSPRNDRLAYLTRAEMRGYLDEVARDHLATEEIGFTGGEPFMNPDLLAMLEDCLARGFKTLVLTNAMRPMHRLQEPLLDLQRRLGRKLTIRVSLDHYTRELHEEERGSDTWQPTVDGLVWLAANAFNLAVAGRMMWGESETSTRQGFSEFFAEHEIPIDAEDPARLVLFPEMDAQADVPEITEACWGILGVAPASLMCATSRMVVKRKGADRPAVVACTLLPYDPQFELGATLAEAAGAVALNHPHCAKFCVLGGGSCSRS